MLKEISQAKKVREDKLKAINLDIPHINASTNLSIVPDENYDDNVKHHWLVESKARQYKSEWREDGPPSRIKDAEVVEVGQGSIDTANKWRESLNEANEELKKLKPSQREYITASEDEGSAKVSCQAHKFYAKSTTREPRGKHNRPIAYLRTSTHDELTSSDYIKFDGKKLPIDQLAWVFADMELRGYTGRLLIIVDNGSQKNIKCSRGMSHLLDSIQEPDFGAIFMTTPNRTFDDAVAFQMLLEAEQIYDGLKIHCSQDTGKCRMEGARKVTERKIRHQAVTDEYNKTVSRVDQRLVSTLSEPHFILHNFMKKAARWSLRHNRLENISSIQAARYGSVSPWITETLRLMNERNSEKKGKKRKAVQPPSIEGDPQANMTKRKKIYMANDERQAKALERQRQKEEADARWQAILAKRIKGREQAKKARQHQAQQHQAQQQQAQRQTITRAQAQFNASLKEGQTVKYLFSPVQIVDFNADRTKVTIRGATGYTTEVNINKITPND